MSNATPRAAWRPLLAGAEAERALAVVHEVAADLERGAGDPGLDPSPLRRSQVSVSGGNGSLALFFAYLDQAFPGRGHDDRALDLLDGVIADMGELHVAVGLYSGFPGVAWLVEHLEGKLIGTEGVDPGVEVAEALHDHLGQSPWRRDYDLISGLAGLGVYALERRANRRPEECLERVLARLAETAERRPDGITWLTPPELLTEQVRAVHPAGNYNLGVAHGVPGVIAMLGEACAAGLEGEALPLLEGAVAWLLAQKLPPQAGSIFPYSVAPGAEPVHTRLAWCYGDLGIAVALLGAARAVGEPAWEREALAVARAAAARPMEESGVVDAGLCHGAAGNAHLFNRLFQASGDPVLEQAARAWLARALDMRQPGQGVGGFLSWIPNEKLALGWRPDPGFLTGSAGIALALLAAATPVEPLWDRLLLASVPPRL
jgi:class I lanthipeptide synthase